MGMSFRKHDCRTAFTHGVMHDGLSSLCIGIMTSETGNFLTKGNHRLSNISLGSDDIDSSDSILLSWALRLRLWSTTSFKCLKFEPLDIDSSDSILLSWALRLRLWSTTSFKCLKFEPLDTDSSDSILLSWALRLRLWSTTSFKCLKFEPLQSPVFSSVFSSVFSLLFSLLFDLRLSSLQSSTSLQLRSFSWTL